MFATPPSRWSARLRAAVAALKAFVLLEKPARSAIRHAGTTDATDATRDPGLDARSPHRAGLATGATDAPERPPHARRATLPRTEPRRPGAVQPRPILCTTPIKRRVDQAALDPPQNARWAARRAAHR
jgi:hypothetical protein